MEKMGPNQTNLVFKQIDDQLLALHKNEREDYPDIHLIHEAIAYCHIYRSHENLLYINRLMSLLYNMDNIWLIWMGDALNTKKVRDFLQSGIPDQCESEEEIEEYREMSRSIFNPAYRYIYKGIKFREYVEFLVEAEKAELILKGITVEEPKNVYLENGPKLEPSLVKDLSILLRGYFPKDHFRDFVDLLVEGKKPAKKLCFKGPSNKLADCFKQLFEANLFIGCNHKTELERWILENFENCYRDNIKPLNSSTLRQTISENKSPCKNPIFEIKKCKETGKVQLIKQ